MRKVVYLFVMVITLLDLYTGCGINGEKSPSATVEAAYMAANDGKYSEAEKYLSSEFINAQKTGVVVLKGVWDLATRNGTIQKIEILKEEVGGEEATVYIKLYFKDGSTKEDCEPLIKENGVWKITAG